MEQTTDIRAVACNYTEAVKTASKGALCYVLQTNPGGGNDRILILSRSRGGRWIEKWEAIRRLRNFRAKTIPAKHPLYGRLGVAVGPESLESLEVAAAYWKSGGLLTVDANRAVRP